MYRWKRLYWYYRKSLTRHGVHSPFVYTFTEQLLKGHYRRALPDLAIPFAFPAPKYALLLRKILAFYGCSLLEINNSGAVTQISLPGSPESSFPRLYLSRLSDCPQPLPGGPGTILVLTGIRGNKEQEAQWQQLREQENVSLSLDLFDMGLLFFEKDFLVRQHFLLRY